MNVSDAQALNKPCDDFYQLYCANSLSNYINESKMLNRPPSADEFVTKYSKDCACYGMNRIPNGQFDVSPRCLGLTNCNLNNATTEQVYLDPSSRGPRCSVNAVTCQQIIDFNNSEVSSNSKLNVAPEISNQCSMNFGKNIGTPNNSGSNNSNSNNSNSNNSRNSNNSNSNSNSNNSNDSNDSNDEENKDKKTETNWMLIGIICGIVVFLIIIVVVLYLVLKKKSNPYQYLQ